MSLTGILNHQCKERKYTETVAAVDLPTLIEGRPELPPKPLNLVFGWDSLELFMRNRSLNHYGKDEHQVRAKVFKLARDEGVAIGKQRNCRNTFGVNMGIAVQFVHPTKGFLLGLRELGFPTKRNFVISRIDPRLDLAYDRTKAARACQWLSRGIKQKYNRRLAEQVGFSSYGGSERDSRNRDVYLKTNVVRIEPRMQKAAAVQRLGLHDPAIAAMYGTDDFVKLFDRLLCWQPYTRSDLARAATNAIDDRHLGRTIEYVERGWLHGRVKLSISEVIEGWQLQPTLDGLLVE